MMKIQYELAEAIEHIQQKQIPITKIDTQTGSRGSQVQLSVKDFIDFAAENGCTSFQIEEDVFEESFFKPYNIGTDTEKLLMQSLKRNVDTSIGETMGYTISCNYKGKDYYVQNKAQWVKNIEKALKELLG